MVHTLNVEKNFVQSNYIQTSEYKIDEIKLKKFNVRLNILSREQILLRNSIIVIMSDYNE